jgi:DNA (cytosine-5)-methyltransferase 1
MQPKAFVMENVTGMVQGAMKQIFIECLAVLRGCGYEVKAEVMNAMHYGTPQSRQRVIFIGFRSDLKVKPTHPKPQTPPMKLKDCIWDLRNIKSEDDRLLDDVVKRMVPYQPKKWASDPRVFKAIKGNLAGSIGLLWGVWDRVCGTVVASEISIVGIVHPDRKRYLSLLELKRVGGFPEDFKFKNRTEGRKQIGNCVPPPLMKSIAEHIKQSILQPVRK